MTLTIVIARSPYLLEKNCGGQSNLLGIAIVALLEFND